MIPKTNVLLDASKKPNTANKTTAPTRPVTSMWTVALEKSDKLEKSMAELGGQNRNRFRPYVDEFVKKKVELLWARLKEGKRINSETLELDAADRGRITGYGHYHLKVGAESGTYVLWYLQKIDSVKQQVQLSLSVLTLHTDYNTKPKQARLLARMPTHYDPMGTLTQPVDETIESSPRRTLFSWLKRSL